MDVGEIENPTSDGCRLSHIHCYLFDIELIFRIRPRFDNERCSPDPFTHYVCSEHHQIHRYEITKINRPNNAFIKTCINPFQRKALNNEHHTMKREEEEQ